MCGEGDCAREERSDMNKTECEKGTEKRPARKRTDGKRAATGVETGSEAVGTAAKTIGKKAAKTAGKTVVRTVVRAAQAARMSSPGALRSSDEEKTQLKLVRKLIEKISQELTCKDNAKGTLGDLLKLMQLEKELAPVDGGAKEIVVKWVAPWDD